jgi:hypothetical protein
MVGPWDTTRYTDRPSVAQGLLKRELARFAEFNDLSVLKYKLNDEIRPTCAIFNMGEYLYKKPWEIYQEERLARIHSPARADYLEDETNE